MIHPLTYDGLDLLRAVLLVHGGVLLSLSSWSAGTEKGPAAVHRPLVGCIHWARAGGQAWSWAGQRSGRHGGKVGRNRSRASGEARRLGEEGEGEGEGGL